MEGSTLTGGTCPLEFFRSNRPGYPYPVCSELENSGIRVSVIAVSLYALSNRQNCTKLYMCMQIHYKHDKDACTAPGVRGHGSIQLSHVVTRIGLHTEKKKTVQMFNHVQLYVHWMHLLNTKICRYTYMTPKVIYCDQDRYVNEVIQP